MQSRPGGSLSTPVGVETTGMFDRFPPIGGLGLVGGLILAVLWYTLYIRLK